MLSLNQQNTSSLEKNRQTTVRFMLYNMEIGADLHKVICCVFLASRCPSRQDVPSVKMSSASSQSCEAVRRQLGLAKMSCFALLTRLISG